MLAERGCREITLLGQTVNSYAHQDGGRPVRFAQLLERVHDVESIDRIRFVTSFPADWDEDIFRVMRDYPRIMPYLHIPAQSGSDAVLARMRRTYTVSDYRRLMDTARRYLPNIALAGDMIVGFCGETEADFRATVDLVRRVEYTGLFVFKYSPRPGTAADRRLDDDVPIEVKQARNNELLAVQAEVGLRRRQALVGRTVEVLVEGYSKLSKRGGERGSGLGDREVSGDGRGVSVVTQESEQDRGGEVGHRPVRQLVGRTPGDLIIVFDGDASMIGALANVQIEHASALTLFGRVSGIVSPPRPPRTADQRQSHHALALPVVSPS